MCVNTSDFIRGPGSRLRKLREYLKYSRKEMARRLDIAGAPSQLKFQELRHTGIKT